MAPYNTQYERLAVHLAAAGVAAEPNLWDCPVTLAREHRRATPDSDAPSAPGALFCCLVDSSVCSHLSQQRCQGRRC